MHFQPIQERRYAQFDRLRHETGLVHAYSTRPANVSPGTGLDNASIARERRTMAMDWGLDPARLRYCQQVRETGLGVIDRPAPGGPLPRCDGVVTALPGLPLITFSADCPLVLLYDPVQRVVGMVHASWRVTVTRATSRLIELMGARFGCRAADLLAGVGPGAGPCCYEVQRDVYEVAGVLEDRDRFFQRRAGRLYFDLWEANRAQLEEAGVPADQIEVASVCTLCRNDLFYSYRREGRGCGHFGLLAALSEKRGPVERGRARQAAVVGAPIGR